VNRCLDCHSIHCICEDIETRRTLEDASEEREVAYFNEFVQKHFKAICRSCERLCPMTEYMHPTTTPPTHGICDVCCDRLI